MLLNADDIVFMAETEEELIKGLSLLEEYCERWNLCVNTNKIKVTVFKKGGQLKKCI